MTLEQKKEFNRFFLQLFNQLLSKEEQLIQQKHLTKLTIRELHVIEAVDVLSKANHNSMLRIAKYLYITPGTLTVSVNQLARKNYVIRYAPPHDRRVSMVELTESGKHICRIHQAFHMEMCRFIDDNMPPSQNKLMLSTLERASEILSKQLEEAVGEN